MGVFPIPTALGLPGLCFLVMALLPARTIGVCTGLPVLAVKSFFSFLFLLNAFFFVSHC